MAEPKSVLEEGFGKLLELFGGSADAASRTAPEGFEPAPNSAPLGATYGVPPRARVYGVQVSNRVGGVLLAGPDRASRSIRITAPVIPFGVFIGVDEAPNVNGFPIIPGLAYEVLVSGFQRVWAITNSPVLVQVLVQVAPLLIGDRERALDL